jgi:hypothetical protein
LLQQIPNFTKLTEYARYLGAEPLPRPGPAIIGPAFGSVAGFCVDVRKIRRAFKVSQAQFAARFGIPAATIRDWEQHRRKPEGAALVPPRAV